MEQNINKNELPQVAKLPGVCIPWEEKLREIPEISGDPQIAKKVWEDVDALGYTYVWHCLVSF
ncbi:MAG: hypothetical protein H0X66_01895 [Verrucomicrobia bacterium]|nr:hypothetical protein [Verrucomicrobiota bacterium]